MGTYAKIVYRNVTENVGYSLYRMIRQVTTTAARIKAFEMLIKRVYKICMTVQCAEFFVLSNRQSARS